MPRTARVVIPGVAHHVTQRGNRRADVFFCDADRREYLALTARYAADRGLRIWAYCLMTNHVHFVAVPAAADSLGRALRDSHQTRRVCRFFAARPFSPRRSCTPTPHVKFVVLPAPPRRPVPRVQTPLGVPKGTFAANNNDAAKNLHTLRY